MNQIGPFHSERRLFTGLAEAALMAWKLTVDRAIAREASPPVRKIQTLISILNG